MRSFTSIVILLGLLPATGGCVDADASEPEAAQAAALTAATTAIAPGRKPRSTNRRLDPSLTNLRPRATTAKPNVDVAIPFDRPANPVVSTPVTSTVASAGTVIPALPLGSGPQRPASRNGAAVTCTPVPAANLACPPDAPVASTCTSADNLPAGCHAMKAPGATYPDDAIPACCS